MRFVAQSVQCDHCTLTDLHWSFSTLCRAEEDTDWTLLGGEAKSQTQFGYPRNAKVRSLFSVASCQCWRCRASLCVSRAHMKVGLQICCFRIAVLLDSRKHPCATQLISTTQRKPLSIGHEWSCKFGKLIHTIVPILWGMVLVVFRARAVRHDPAIRRCTHACHQKQ